MYRPLPKYLTIKPSAIEGLGLFATQDIDDNETLAQSHYIPNKENDNVDFIFGKNYNTIRLEAGAWLNHSLNPNCIITGGIGRFHYVHSVKDIKAGEELTVNYNEAFCGSYVKEFEGGE